MLLCAVSVLVVAQSSSETPEGLMNNPVYCVYATLGTCYSVWKTVRYAGWNEFHPAYRTVSHTENKYQVSHKHSVCLLMMGS